MVKQEQYNLNITWRSSVFKRNSISFLGRGLVCNRGVVNEAVIQ